MMIESNASLASSMATGIASGASGILGVGHASPDGVSSFHGNHDAVNHLGKESNYAGQVASKLTSYVTLIHSIASEFEAVDQSLSASIGQEMVTTSPVASPQAPLPHTDTWDRLLVD